MRSCAVVAVVVLGAGCLGGGKSGGTLTGSVGGRELNGVVLDTVASGGTYLDSSCRSSPGGSMSLVYAEAVDGGSGAVRLSFGLRYERLRLNYDENRDRVLVANPNAMSEPGWLTGGDASYRWRLSHPEGSPAFEGGRLTFERALTSRLLGELTLTYADGGALVGAFDLDSDRLREVECDDSFDPFSALPIPGPH